MAPPYRSILVLTLFDQKSAHRQACHQKAEGAVGRIGRCQAKWHGYDGNFVRRSGRGTLGNWIRSGVRCSNGIEK